MKKVQEIESIVSSKSPCYYMISNDDLTGKGSINHYCEWNRWIGWWNLFRLIRRSVKDAHEGNYFTITFKV